MGQNSNVPLFPCDYTKKEQISKNTGLLSHCLRIQYQVVKCPSSWIRINIQKSPKVARGRKFMNQLKVSHMARCTDSLVLSTAVPLLSVFLLPWGYIYTKRLLLSIATQIFESKVVDRDRKRSCSIVGRVAPSLGLAYGIVRDYQLHSSWLVVVLILYFELSKRVRPIQVLWFGLLPLASWTKRSRGNRIGFQGQGAPMGP